MPGWHGALEMEGKLSQEAVIWAPGEWSLCGPLLGFLDPASMFGPCPFHVCGLMVEGSVLSWVAGIEGKPPDCVFLPVREGMSAHAFHAVIGGSGLWPLSSPKRVCMCLSDRKS